MKYLICFLWLMAVCAVAAPDNPRVVMAGTNGAMGTPLALFPYNIRPGTNVMVVTNADGSVTLSGTVSAPSVSGKLNATNGQAYQLYVMDWALRFSKDGGVANFANLSWDPDLNAFMLFDNVAGITADLWVNHVYSSNMTVAGTITIGGTNIGTWIGMMSGANIYPSTNVANQTISGTKALANVSLASASLMVTPGEPFQVFGTGFEGNDLAVAMDAQTNMVWSGTPFTDRVSEGTWGVAASWTSNSLAWTHVAGSTVALSNQHQVIGVSDFPPIYYYRVSFSISNRTSGYINSIKVGSRVYVGESFTNNGSYSTSWLYVATPTNTTSSKCGTFITPSSDFDGTIYNVRTLEITNATYPTMTGSFVETWDATNSLRLWLSGTNLPNAPPVTAVDGTILSRGTNGAVVLPVTPFASVGYSDVPRAIWAYSGGSGWSSPLQINQPEIWGAYPERPAPGDYVKIWGINFGMRGGGQTTIYSFAALVDSTNGMTFVPWFQDVQDAFPAQEYTLCNVERVIQIPTNITPGSYRLYLNTGVYQAPSDWAWSAGFPIIVWTNEIKRPTFFCNPPEGTNDALADIQYAINYCDTNGGGTVQLPAGTFTVSSNLTWDMCSNRVVLKGAGKTATILRGAPNIAKCGFAWVSTYNLAPVIYMSALANGGGLEDMSIVCPPHPSSNWFSYCAYVFYAHSGFANSNVLHNIAFKNCLFRREGMSPSLGSTWSGDNSLLYLWGAFRNLEISDCEFLNGKIAANSATIYNGNFQRNSWPMFEPNACYGCLFSENKIEALIPTFGARNYVVRNRIEGRKWLSGSSESLLYHSTPDYTFYSAPVSTTTNTVTITSWPTYFWAEYAYGSERDACVTVVKGTGFGQCRRITSHTTDTATLERNWSVQPDATSLLVFSYGWNENIQVENKFHNCVTAGAYIYGSALRNVCAADEYVLCQGATSLSQIYAYPMSFNVIRDTRSILSGPVSIYCGAATNYMTNVSFMIGNELRKNQSFSPMRLPDNWYGWGADGWNSAYGIETKSEGTSYYPPIGKESATHITAASTWGGDDDDAGYDLVPVKPIAWTLVTQCISANAPRSLRITRAADHTTVYNLVSSASNNQISDSGSRTVILSS